MEGLNIRQTRYTSIGTGVLYGNNTQTNANGGFFHRGYGRRLTFSGEFRHFGDHILAMGVSYAMNSEGVYNRF